MKFCICCNLFKMLCCPPCPQHIIERIAFQPPPPTYNVYFNKELSKYTFDLEKNLYSSYIHRRMMVQIKESEFTYTTTKHNTKIACIYYKVKPATKYTILYSHGNGSDLGIVIGLCVWIAKETCCNILAYDYSGYGQSSGKPTEKKIYTDIEAAYQLLLDQYNCSPEDIILFGQSLGSAPTIDLASRTNVRGVVIQSGFVSAINVVAQEQMTPSCCDSFENIDKISKVTSPVLIIHGTDDDVIKLWHGIALYEQCPRAVEPLWLEGAGHDNVELYNQYIQRLKRFVSVDLL